MCFRKVDHLSPDLISLQNRSGITGLSYWVIMFDRPLILNGVGESRLDLVIDRYRLAFIEPSYIQFV